ncbi:MAG: restriction endonuclease subunit S [Anaerolineae bacterium]|nr:restriction endonuclease subunit S [Anaerolineae bacterium]
MQPYPAYKDSGDPILGCVPDHWRVANLKRVATFLYGQSLPKDVRNMGSVPVYGSNGTSDTHDEAITTAPCIVIGRKGSHGKINYSHGPCFPIDTTFYVDSTATEHNVRWLYYLLSILRLDAYSKDSAVPGLNREEAYERRVVIPERMEQSQIARFLDERTAKIDALIAKKRRQIDLLQEQRAALINQAVTKGLDRNRPMKDSGVPWIGEIPAEWTVAPVYSKYLVQLGKMLDKKRITGKHLGPYLRNVDVQWDSINVDNLPKMDFHPDEWERYGLKVGDLLVCEGGEVGRAAIWNGSLEPCYYQKALHRLRPINDHDHSRFMFYLLRMAANRGLFVSTGNLTTIDHLTGEKLRQHRFPFAPSAEQERIACYLDQETDRIDTAIQSIEGLINLLSEYRTALISAAVTGKIDVRDVGV